MGSASISERPGGGDAARVARYEMDTLLAELTALEESIPGGASNLRGRPHVARLMGTRAGGLCLDVLQHLLRGAAAATRRLRAPAADGVPGSLAWPARPALTEVAFAPAILERRPRILIDVTATARYPAVRGGIPRLVREMAKAAVETAVALPVVMEQDRLRAYFRHPRFEGAIAPGKGDIYIVADNHWYFAEEYRRMVASVRQCGASVGLVVHDLFPISHPFFFPPEIVRSFEASLCGLLAESRYCMSISRFTDRSVQDFLAEIAFPRRGDIAFDWFPMGVSARQDADARAARPEIAALFAPGRTFLGVGTLEPRKGYAVALDACDLAWERGLDFSYVIIGGYGWRAQALRDRILGHPEHGRRLFWIRDAGDADLAAAYASCRSLIQASIAEGFGLPIIEATRAGAPIIASDLSVFREIAGDQLAYFPVASPEGLAERMAAALATRPAAARIEVPDWPEAMRSFAARLAAAAG